MLRPILALALAIALPASGLAAVPAPPAEAPAGDPAYDEALDTLRARRWGEGSRLLDRYLEGPAPAHRAEAEALRELARHLAVTAEAGGLPEGAIDQRGRAQLAVFSTLYGLWTGGALSFLLETESFSSFLMTTATVGGIGLGASLAATAGRPIPEGRASLISMGGLWGTVNAATFGYQAGLEGKGLLWTTLGAGAAGIALGATVFDEAPDPGYLSLVNSAGLWSGYATSLVLVMAEADGLDEEDVIALVVGGADLGLLVGAFAARDVAISPGRVRLIDLGGLLGTLGGAAIVSAETGDSGAAYAVPLLLGTGAGLALATVATSTWDDPPGGEIRSDHFRGPGPAILPGTDGKSVAFGLNLASGTF